MKSKKFASLALAIVMVLALAVPVFAQSPTYSDKQSQSVTMKGGMTVPKIQIQLPSGTALTQSFLLNPYKITYSGATVGGTSISSGAGGSTAPQVISPVLQIVNGTNSKMQVDVTVTTTVAGNLKLLAADYADDNARKADTKNNAFLFLNLKNSTSSSDAGSTTAATFVGSGDADKQSIILKAGDVKKTGALYTDEASKDSPKYINIQFGGSMAEAPSTPWTDKDVATVAFAFTFTPNQNVTVTSG
jgi:hypothetical protein